MEVYPEVAPSCSFVNPDDKYAAEINNDELVHPSND
jgi:hypothetical protein